MKSTKRGQRRIPKRLRVIIESLGNLEEFDCGIRPHLSVPALDTFWARLFSEQTPRLRRLKMLTTACSMIRSGIVNLENTQLPDSLESVIADFGEDEEHHRVLFHALDHQLPRLQHLELRFWQNERSHEEIFAFRRLLQRRHALRIIWPRQRRILSAATGLQKLEVIQLRKYGQPLLDIWAVLRSMADLKTITFWQHPISSILTNLSSVPQIKRVKIVRPFDDLDEAGKRVVAALKRGADQLCAGVRFWGRSGVLGVASVCFFRLRIPLIVR